MTLADGSKQTTFLPGKKLSGDQGITIRSIKSGDGAGEVFDESGIGGGQADGNVSQWVRHFVFDDGFFFRG